MTTHDPALVELVYRTLGSLFRGQADQRDARAVLDAITTSPRHALVELPEPREVTVLNNAWWLDGDVTAVVGSGRVRCELDDHRMTSGNARELAAALLAAARAAESGSTTPENKEN